MKGKFKTLGSNADGEEKVALDGETSKPSLKKSLEEKRKNLIKDNHKENLLFVEQVKKKKKRP